MSAAKSRDISWLRLCICQVVGGGIQQDTVVYSTEYIHLGRTVLPGGIRSVLVLSIPGGGLLVCTP